MLIATLPAIHQRELTERIIAHELIGGVRYNVGARSPYSPRRTLEQVLELTNRYDKKLWIDLKGRQLRIVKWAVPNFGTIALNHKLEVDCPAQVFFRGNERSEIKVVRGNMIFVDPQPPSALGAGQAINIHGENLKIHGYLTSEDRKYIQAACKLGILNFMLSFVEEPEDIAEVREILNADGSAGDYKPVELVLKIESPKGLDFIGEASDKALRGCTLMAARDDLMINIGPNKMKMLSALQDIIAKDPNAIVASRIFAGLESGGITMGDISDLKLMHLMGYGNFMLSDGICQRHFGRAVEAWRDFQVIKYMLDD